MARDGLGKKEVCLVGSEVTALGEQRSHHWLGDYRPTGAVFQTTAMYGLAHLCLALCKAARPQRHIRMPP